VVLLDEPHVDISASQIRERVAAGLSITDLVPAAVAEYIAANGLYRGLLTAGG
jgi:nicotinic acid mononucleotide adenylyltransferase